MNESVQQTFKVGVPTITHPGTDAEGNPFPPHMCDAEPIINFRKEESPAQRLRRKFLSRTNADHHRIMDFIASLGFDKL